jgi:hypothetical protein
MLLKKSVRANDPNFSVTWARLPKKYVGGTASFFDYRACGIGNRRTIAFSDTCQ